MAIFGGGLGGARALTPEQEAARKLAAANAVYKGLYPGLTTQMNADPALGVDANLLATGRDTSPLTGGITEGIARVLSGFAGGQFQRKDMAGYKAAEDIAADKTDAAYTAQRQQDALDRANDRADRQQLMNILAGRQQTAPGASVINPNAATPTPPGLTPDQAAPLQAARTVAGAFNNAPGVPVPNNVAMLGPQGGPLGTGPALPPQQGAVTPPAIPTNPIVSPAKSGAAPTASTRANTGFGDYRSSAYDPLEEKYAAQYGIPVSLLRSVRLNGEKSNADQVSSAKAKSVYQITPGTQAGIIKNYGFDPLSSPENSVRGAAAVLAENWKRSGGDPQETAISYIAGPPGGGVRGRQSQAYANRVVGGMGGATGGATGGGPPGTAPINIPTPPTVAQPALVAPPEMPAEIPLPERIQSTRLGIADRLLSGLGPGEGALGLMAAQPFMEQGLTEDQASKQSAYDAAVKSIQMRQQAGLQLYNTEHAARQAAQIGDYTAARQQQYALQGQQYGAELTGAAANQAGQIAVQAAEQKHGFTEEEQRLAQQGQAATQAFIASMDNDSKQKIAEASAYASSHRMPQSLAKELTDNTADIQYGKLALQTALANPNEFGEKFRLSGDITSRTNPEGVRARAMVRNFAGAVVKARAGSAVSASEDRRLAGYMPVDSDNAQTIANKIRSYLDWMQIHNNAITANYGKPGDSIYSNTGSGPSAAAGTGGGWSTKFTVSQ
jgi:hypothetical protein